MSKLNAICVCLSLITLMSCSDLKVAEVPVEERIPFNASQWQIKEGKDYPYRNAMVNDVLMKDSLRSLKKVDLIRLLGPEDRKNEKHYYYTIAQNRLNFWPIHTKTLVIKFTSEGSVEWMKIHE